MIQCTGSSCGMFCWVTEETLHEMPDGAEANRFCLDFDSVGSKRESNHNSVHSATSVRGVVMMRKQNVPWLTFCVRLFSQRRCVLVSQDKLIALRSLVATLCYIFGIMAILLQDKLEIEKSEWEGVSVRKQSVRAGRFLTDANIIDVFKTLGPTLPDSVLRHLKIQTSLYSL